MACGNGRPAAYRLAGGPGRRVRVAGRLGCQSRRWPWAAHFGSLKIRPPGSPGFSGFPSRKSGRAPTPTALAWRGSNKEWTTQHDLSLSTALFSKMNTRLETIRAAPPGLLAICAMNGWAQEEAGSAAGSIKAIQEDKKTIRVVVRGQFETTFTSRKDFGGASVL